VPVAESTNHRRIVQSSQELTELPSTDLGLLVIVSHAITLGNFGNEAIIGHATLGDISVDGFFGISGFLVAGSAATSRSMGRYAWHRFLRIFPGIWVCLIVIAFVIAPLAFLHQDPGKGLGAYFSSATGPIPYLASNFSATQIFALNAHFVVISPATAIAGTLAHPFSRVVGWSIVDSAVGAPVLFALGCSGLFGRTPKTMDGPAFVPVTWGLAWANYLDPDSLFHGSFNWTQTLRLVAIFITGSLMYLYSQSIPDSTIIAGGATVLFLYGLSLPDTYNSDVLCGPAFVYIVIWLGIHLPFHRIGKRNDLSFGVYIYGFAVQQLLAVWGVYRWGYVPYMGLAVLLSLFLAAVSWRLVESQAMRLKHWTPSLRRSSPDGIVAEGAQMRPSAARHYP
jgi:peptidoglycan/LPS O-acetylase OafA/YrhL